jgi:hypothetical protein
MRYIRPGVLIATLVLLPACGAVPPGTPASTPAPSGSGAASGVAGMARVDAGCPVLRPGETCPMRPVRARITVTAPGASAVLAAVTSTPEGRFRIGLAPGTYVLTGRNTTGAAVPTAMPVHVRVWPGRWTQVTVDFDSGVR